MVMAITAMAILTTVLVIHIMVVVTGRDIIMVTIMAIGMAIMGIMAIMADTIMVIIIIIIMGIRIMDIVKQAILMEVEEIGRVLLVQI